MTETNDTSQLPPEITTCAGVEIHVTVPIYIPSNKYWQRKNVLGSWITTYTSIEISVRHDIKTRCIWGDFMGEGEREEEAIMRGMEGEENEGESGRAVGTSEGGEGK